MTIGAILRERTGTVIAARPVDTVRAVIDLLAQNRIGAVPVVEGDAVVGIFSERDTLLEVIRLVRRRQAPAAEAPVQDAI